MKKISQQISFIIALASLVLMAKPVLAKPANVVKAGQVSLLQKVQVKKENSPAPVVNINTASTSEIMFLPGIGPSKAEAIIAYRNKHHFVRKSQLLRVHGIGPKSLRRLRPLITINGPTTMTEKAHARR